MKMILISIVAVMGMVLCGWLTFASSDDVVSVSVDTAEVKKDTAKAVEAGEELIDKVSEVAGNAVEDTEEAVDNAINNSTADDKSTESAEPVENPKAE